MQRWSSAPVRSLSRRALAVTLSVGLLAALVPEARAQDDESRPPIEIVYGDAETGCIESGERVLCDGFYWGSADAVFGDLGTGADGVELRLRADFGSTFWLEVADGATTGSWDIDGQWTMDFGGAVEGRAEVALVGTGTAQGSNRAFSVSGTQSNEGTARILGVPQPISNSGPLDPVTVTVTGGNCAEVVGEWKISWAALAAEVGWTGSDTISGVFTAVRQEQADVDAVNEFAKRVASGEEIGAEIDAAPLPDVLKQLVPVQAQWNRLVDSIPPGEPRSDVVVNRFLDLLEELERLSAVARNASACEQELLGDTLQRLTSAHTGSAESLVRELRRDGTELSGFTLRRVVEMAVRTGVLGSGSSLQPATQTELRNILNDRIGETLTRLTRLEANGDVSSQSEATIPEELAGVRAAILLGAETVRVHGEGVYTSTYVKETVEGRPSLEDRAGLPELFRTQPEKLSLDWSDLIGAS